MVDGENNGRVTMAILSTKLDTVIDKLDDLARLQATDHDRIGVVERDVAVVKERQGLWATAITVFNGVVAYVIARVATK